MPADTLIVFVGGYDLGGPIGRGGPGGISGGGGSPAWVNAVLGRGESGALASPETDFAPWGGTITFNNTVDWHFQTNGRPAGSNSFDFISTALHEFGHLLGIGTADSWDAQIVSSQFNGVRSAASFGGPVPVASDNNHWLDDGNCPFDPNGVNNVASRTYGSFGTGHGSEQIAILDPSSCLILSNTNLRVFTDLDLAALSDIGWELRYPLRVEPDALGPGESSLLWPSSTGSSVFLQRATEPGGPWQDILASVQGDGMVKQIIDNNAPSGRAFYRLSEATSLQASASILVSPREVRALSAPIDHMMELPPSEPRMVESCGICVDCSH